MIEIAGRKVGPEYPPFMIADVGANHDGNLGRALELIFFAAEAGADAVKFQNFSAPKIVSKRGFEELGQVGHQEAWSKSVYETYEGASIPLHWTRNLAEQCEKYGVAYLTTPYDLEAVDAIDPYVPAWKIGSGDITYHELIRKVASKGKPILLATGASGMFDVNRALHVLAADGHNAIETHSLCAICLMHCNSNYTGNPENLNFLNLQVIRNWTDPTTPVTSGVDCVGLSDHTSGHLAVCAAIALGACVIEKHFTDDRSRKGPDHAFAMEPDEWVRMVIAANRTWEALGDGVKRVEENEKEAVIVQRRALRWKATLSPGMQVRRGEIIATRPCPEGALEPYHIDELVDRVVKRKTAPDTLVSLEDFE